MYRLLFVGPLISLNRILMHNVNLGEERANSDTLLRFGHAISKKKMRVIA